MDGAAVSSERDFLGWCLQQPSVSHHKFTTQRPNFLVISPPKTGSTWLAANLRCHPEVYINDIKEVKYFSSFFKWLDLNWYLDHFIEGAGRLKGEATPSYALLPVARIQLIRRLFPDIKLLFLMREPAGRAWSHAKHNHHYREANFASSTMAFDAVSDREWCENFGHDWPLASGDYLGQLRRWLSVFPRKQFYVGFYESIAARPQALLRDIFAFLGVKTDVDLASFRASERILAGPPGDLRPDLHRRLHRLLHDRTRELAFFVRERFDLETPAEWNPILERPARPVTCPAPGDAFLHEFDDGWLGRVLEQEKAFPAPGRMVFESYKGYNLFFHAGRLIALAQGLGPVAVETLNEADLRRFEEGGHCFIVSSLAEMKERVDQHVYHRTQTNLGAVVGLHDNLRDDIRARMCRLESAHGDIVNAFRVLDAEAIRLSPWAFSLLYILRKVWRGLRAALKGKAMEPAPQPAAPAPDVS